MRPLAFQPWTGQHLLLLVLFALGLVGAALLGAAHRGKAHEQAARRTLAAAVAGVGLAMQAYQLTPGDFDGDTSLPLQLCDLGTVAAVVALWTRDARFSAFTYYVGLTLTVQAVLTPSLAEEFPHPRFFGFWLLHFLVIWAAVYLTWGLGIRPTWRLYRTTVAATLCWVVVVFAFNLVAGTNYGYLNRKPSAGSLLDLLGPWPLYVVLEVGIVATVWAVLLTWPWTRRRRTSRSGDRSRVRARSRRTSPTDTPRSPPARPRGRSRSA